MENQNYCVYMHTNSVNGKKYIGITCKEPQKRWSNGKGYCHNKYFYRAINKYGWNSFRHDILFTKLTKDEACNLEIWLIAKFKTQDHNYGYNIMAGGQNCTHTEESKQKMRGRSVSEETRQKMCKRRMTMEAKRNIGLHNPLVRKVFCDNKIFHSVRECSKEYNVHENSMRDWLKGRTAMPEKFYLYNLRYLDENPNYIKIKTKKFEVICDGKIFYSITDCARYYEVPTSSMASWLSERKEMPIKFQTLNLRYGNIYRYIANPTKI